MSYLDDSDVCKVFEETAVKPIKEAVAGMVGRALTIPEERQDMLEALAFLDVKFQELLSLLRKGTETINSHQGEPGNV